MAEFKGSGPGGRGSSRARRAWFAAVTLAIACAAPAAAADPSTSESADPANSVISSSAKAAHVGLPNSDVRGGDVARIPAATSAAQAKLQHSLGPGALLETDPTTGAVRSLGRFDGLLTGPSDRPAGQIALGFVRAHHAAFGISAADVSSLRPFHHYTGSSGIRHLSYIQTVDGIPVFGAGLKANVTRSGQLINIVDGPAPNVALTSTTPDLGAGEAVRSALRNGQAASANPGKVKRSASGADELTTFTRGNRASLVIFPTANGGRLGWQVNANATSTGTYIDVVDAATGKVLHRQNQVSFDSDATGQAWQYAPDPGGTYLPAGVGTQAQVHFPVNNTGSALSGNNAHTYADIGDSIAVPGGTVPASAEIPATTTGANPAWNYGPSLNTDSFEFRNCDPDFPCTWDSFTAFSWRDNTTTFDGNTGTNAGTGNLRQNATQVYYFVNNFHDFLRDDPQIQFTAAAGNFQADGGDAVQAQVLDGADTDSGFPDGDHQNNANMATQQDGIPPRMQMYLFTNGAFGSNGPDANGGDDASVIYHEYTHGLSNRLVTQPNGVPGLSGHQSRSMGEGWSDWYAMDYLVSRGFDADTAAVGDMNVGFFVMGASQNALRTEPLDCPANNNSSGQCPGGSSTGPGGYTLGDMGKVTTGPEVHADGEIWEQTLWQVRQALGADVSEKLITQGMQLSPAAPSMLDMRNAILQADQASFGGANTNTLWSVFANRGMGYFASDSGADDTTPTENFQIPPGCSLGCGTVAGRVLDGDTLKPVANATVAIRGATGLSATTNVNGQYTIANVPQHTYETLTVSRAGYVPVQRSSITVAGGTNTLNFTIRRDWADTGSGALVTRFSPPDFTSFGCGPGHAFDNSLSSGWTATSLNPANPSEGPGGPKSATVRLPNVIDLTGLAVDPAAGCGLDSNAATRSLKIETSPNGITYTTVANPTFTSSQVHQLNTVTPSTKPKKVRFLRVTMQSNQNPNAGAGTQYMGLGEVAIYGRPSDLIKPVISNASIAPGQTVRSIVARGFKISSRLSEAGTEKGTLQISAQKAQQLGIPRTIGTGTLAFAAAATKTMTMNLTTRAKNKLKTTQGSLPVTATLNATDKAANKATPVSKTTILPH